ncbi:MAG: hypothetical protein V4633_15960 [Pseudomonadota bacterium]
MIQLRLAAGAAALLLTGSGAWAGMPAALQHALSGERIGLLPAAKFRLSTGKCSDCPTLKQGLWYFKDEVLAVPHATEPVAGFKPGAGIVDTVADWAGSGGTEAALHYPGLVWLGAPHILDNASILPSGQQLLMSDGAPATLKLVPRIPTNLSYWNDGTTAFFAQRQVRMRGTYSQDADKPAFTARTVWPKDFTLDPDKVALKPFGDKESLTSFVQDQGGGAASPYATRLLWERAPGKGRTWQDKPVIGVMLNGAQGDDDEAFGGHFAIATGTIGKQGQWSDWLVNNFYNLDSFSEKGIVAAPVPMDNYLMDINSGQQYYRPSYMLVAILNNARTAAAYQGGVQRVFNQFYRHDFTYRHAAANCAGISLDVFKALGWNIPERGPTSRIKALGAYAYLSVKDRSLASGRRIYDYLTEEQIRLYPAVAFDAAGQDLMRLVGAAPGFARTPSAYEKQLQSDVEAIVLVRIPQIPSSRVMGSNPVFSFDEFMARTPPDQKDWKIVPAGPRPFPAELRDAGVAQAEAPGPVPLPVAGIGVVGMIGIGALVRRRRKRPGPSPASGESAAKPPRPPAA